VYKHVIKFCVSLVFSNICFAIDTVKKTENRIENKEAYAFYLENDSRNIGGPGSDQAYTNGMKFSYIYAQGKIPKWSNPIIDRFHVLDGESKWARINFGASLGHQMFTPNNTQSIDLITDDRPYAAWLYLGFAVSLKEKYVEHFLEIDLGTVGPSALGEQAQNSFHGVIRSNKASGWSNGLKDEPTLQAFYQKRFKMVVLEYIDFIPYYGAGFGNVLIGGHLGGMIRIGPHLPDDFGVSRPSASDGNSFITSSVRSTESQQSYYFFVSTRGNYVNTNIFLDGNSYQKSHSVKKHPLVFETELGLGLHFDSGIFVWRFVTKSPEFEARNKFSSFASMSFMYVP
jgi:lipid A 3-O-deacylase